MRFTSLFFSVLVLVVGANSAAFEQRAVSNDLIERFGKRQISVTTGSGTVPSQCTSVCNPVNDEVSLGCPVTSCCAPTFQTAYYNCLVCVGTALDATNYTTAQNDLNLLFITCRDMGYTLPQLTLPGQQANGSSSSSPNSTPSTSFSTSVTTTSSINATPTTAAKSGAVASRGSAEVLVGAAILLGVFGLW